MLSAIKRIVLISLFILSFAEATNNVIDIKKMNILNTQISLSKYTVFELPFVIEDNNIRIIKKRKIKKSSFDKKLKLLNNKQLSKNDNNLLSDNKKPPLPEPNQSSKKKEKEKQSSSKINQNQIKYTSNYLEIFPKELGIFEVIIFGGSKPIILSLEVKNDIGVKYYKFIDSEIKKKSDSLDFNITATKKGIFLNYFRFLYSNKDIPNFEKITSNMEKEYYNGKIITQLTKYFKNDKYEIKEYLVTNNLPINYYINSDTFKEYNTQAISFVSQDNFIYKEETTRFFIINKL